MDKDKGTGDEAQALERAVSKASGRLLPFLTLLLILCVLDRANIGLAKLAYQADTGISDAAYAFGAGIFFLGYALFEVPSNLILHRVGARVWLSRIMVTWGLVSASMMFSTTPISLYVLRFLLGVCEAGFYPGVLLYLTYWFPNRQRARATGLFYLGVPLSLVLGSPLSAWLLTYHVSGLSNWQLMFVVEGLAASVAGVIAFFYLDNRPQDAKWLSEEEKVALGAVLDLEEQGKLREIRHSAFGVLKDSRVLLFIGVYFTIQLGAAPLTLYLPSKLASALHGKVDLAAGLVIAIPYLCTAIAILGATVYADRRDNHRFVAIAMLTAGTVALASIAFISNVWVTVIAGSIAVAGISGSQPVFWSLPTRYLGGTGAASGIAFIVSLGNLGSFLSPQIYTFADMTLHRPDVGFLVLGLVSFGSVLLLVRLGSATRGPEFNLEPSKDSCL